MRSQKQRDRSKKLMVYLMAFLMVSSLFGVIYFGFNDPEAKKKYNGYTFKKTTSGYQTTISGSKVTFTYFPGDIETVKIDPEIINLLKNAQVISTTSAINDTLKEVIASIQFTSSPIFTDLAGIPVVQGFLTENPYKPTITCQNATMQNPVILYEYASSSEILRDESCIIISARTPVDLLVLSERLLYSQLGVM